MDVVVIGAGAAGLSATSELLKKGKKVLCVEALDRIGGRCYTENNTFGIPWDVGAHWLHDYTGNLIAKYGKNNSKFNVYQVRENILVYEGLNRISPNKLFQTFERVKRIKNQLLNSKIDLNYNIKPFKNDIPFIDQIPEKLKENEWFETVHQALGASLASVDFDNYTIYDELLNYKKIGENDGFVEEGYGFLLANLRRDIKVKLDTIVKEIKWDSKGVIIETNQGSLKSKMCIITVSTNVLSSGIIKFSPSLPIKKYEAFNGITMGTYNHITLQLKESFYKNFEILPDTYLFSKITEKNKSPKGYFGSLRLHKSNLSYFDVGGEFGKDLEKAGEKASIDFVLSKLKSTFGSKIEEYLIKACATKWGKNKYTQGSYSCARPGKAHLRPYLKKNVADKIFFAGEATSSSFGTVHGADLSGKEVADEILKLSAI